MLLKKFYAYDEIVFIQSSDDIIEPETIFNEHGLSALLDYLKQWDYGEHNNIYVSEPFGNDDDLELIDDYIISMNFRRGYVGLSRGLSEAEYNQIMRI